MKILSLEKALLTFVIIFVIGATPHLDAQTTEKYVGESNEATQFTEGGLTFNVSGNFEVYVRSGYGLDDDNFIENVNNPIASGGVVGSFTNSSNNFYVNSLYITPVQIDNYTVSIYNNLIIRGKLDGSTEFTHTILYTAINNSSANNYYTYVDLNSYSAIAINEVEFEIEPYGTNETKFLEIDDFTFTPIVAPTTQATNVTFTSVSSGNATLSWTRGNGSNCAVFMKDASSGTASPVDNTTYTANATFSSGTQIGATGWYCVYNGTGATVDVSGISDGTTYQVHICEYNGSSGSEFYNTTSATGNPDNEVLPVELTNFTANICEEEIKLNWQTATEVNNYGFQVERQILNQVQNDKWESIAFVEGHGNSNSPKEYSFIDSDNLSRLVQYRLKQIDIDGGFEYSDVVEVEINSTKEFKLAQNFPNPFNPTTKIDFSIPSDNNVEVKVFNTLGMEVATLVNGYKNAGTHSVEFNANNLSSGIYFYKIVSGNYSDIKKMILLR